MIERVTFTVQLYDETGVKIPENTDSGYLHGIVFETNFKDEYLLEQFLWQSDFDDLKVVSVPDNHTIIFDIEHDGVDDLKSYIEDFMESEGDLYENGINFYPDGLGKLFGFKITGFKVRPN